MSRSEEAGASRRGGTEERPQAAAPRWHIGASPPPPLALSEKGYPEAFAVTICTAFIRV